MADLPCSPGLADVLSGRHTIGDVVNVDRATAASIITAGKTLRSPLELLGSPAMHDLLNDLRKQYEIVLIDAPPVLAVPDVSVLARLSDLTIMAVRWGKTSSQTLALAMARLSDFGIDVRGVLMTMVSPRHYETSRYLRDRPALRIGRGYYGS
jgi:Mrp family chromosome partitioning ATPase